MNTDANMNRWTLTLLLIVTATVALARYAPHLGILTPIGAFALFSGAYVNHRLYLLLPLAAMLVADVFSGFYLVPVMVAVYLGFMASAVAGRLILHRRRTPLRFVGAVLVGAVLFYLISCMGSWLGWPHWPNTLQGLIDCWIFGLPYLFRAIVGDFLYGIVIFGLVEWYLLSRGSTARSLPRSG